MKRGLRQVLQSATVHVGAARRNGRRRPPARFPPAAAFANVSRDLKGHGWPGGMAAIYHICREADWRAAQAQGRYRGSVDDLRDGFIHFSTAAQVAASAARHRAGQAGLVLIEADPAALGPALRWEPARSAALFPHFYGVLPVAAARRVTPLPLGADGRHVFPALDGDAAR